MTRTEAIALAAGTVCLAIAAAGTVAHSHSWYEPSCCSERDCAPVPSGTRIDRVKGGYNVLFPGADEPLFFPDEKVKPSRDNDWHTCIGPDSGIRFCLYAPLNF